jgi:hypothetical protein
LIAACRSRIVLAPLFPSRPLAHPPAEAAQRIALRNGGGLVAPKP